MTIFSIAPLRSFDSWSKCILVVDSRWTWPLSIVDWVPSPDCTVEWSRSERTLEATTLAFSLSIWQLPWANWLPTWTSPGSDIVCTGIIRQRAGKARSVYRTVPRGLVVKYGGNISSDEADFPSVSHWATARVRGRGRERSVCSPCGGTTATSGVVLTLVSTLQRQVATKEAAIYPTVVHPITSCQLANKHLQAQFLKGSWRQVSCMPINLSESTIPKRRPHMSSG